MLKNIAIVLDSLAGGGAEKVMLNLASHMLKSGHRVTLFSLKTLTQYEVPKGINLVFPLSEHKGSLRSWFNRQRLASMLKASMHEHQGDQAFDLILVNLHESYKVVSACNLNKVYYVIHNSFVQELKRELKMGPLKYFYMKHILKMLNDKDLIGVSKGVTQELQASGLFKARSIRHIYNPFPIDDIKKMSLLDDEVSVNKPFILHVGRAAKAKRHDILFKAMKDVEQDIRLVCLSTNQKKLNKLAKQYQISDRVITPGFSHNPYAWMKAAKLVVLSSDFEGLSMVLLESLIVDTPVVSTRCPHGPEEIMTGELAKYLVDVGDAKALGKAINQALIEPPELTNIAILQHVSIETITKQYLSLCESPN